ncbi:Sir2 family NAD-dependent protein deacetylase [Blastococcus mobilis]|uniref:protein acetyllysine N-acetyltransferase n=1 Tax=Blastococcus mobilis TaxID=1938746 RepID=A0A238Y9U3_9ACTN|nr:Sir2 family NAD-dependent protein deacetylase [Blastococcus mobilis]SNR67588.1 Sir2 family protein [Blastococcus mobilis]
MIALSGVPTDEASMRYARDLAHMGWTFRSRDRVLSFCGYAPVSRAGQLRLAGWVASCSLVPARERLADRTSAVDVMLRACGWRPTGESTWSRVDSGHQFQTIVWSVTLGAEPTLHVVITHGADAVLLTDHWWPAVTEAARRAPVVDVSDTPTGGGRSQSTPVITDDTALLVDMVRAARGVIVLTGAGISVAAGLPALSEGDPLAPVPLYEPFPGAALDWIIDRPYAAAAHFGEIHRRFLAARPAAAHRALADLEKAGFISAVVTTNHDRLHQLAGSRRVVSPAAWLREHPGTGGLSGWGLVVVGVSEDEHGAIAHARRQGAWVTVVDPAGPPPGIDADAVIQAEADDVLTALAADLASAVGPIR